MCALPSLLVPGRACASSWGEGSRERKWDEEGETATTTPSDNVELLSGSSQQVCSSGVGVGVRGVREQGWER